LGIQRDEEELVDGGDGGEDGEGTAGTNVVEGADAEHGADLEEKVKEGEISPSFIKRGRSADLEEGDEEVAGKKVKIGGMSSLSTSTSVRS
jgi:hypothetical protein